MLDSAIKEQLQSVFSVLENKVELVYDESSHADQSELIEMLQEIASTSPQIIARPASTSSSEKSKTPQFHIEYKGRHTGIIFKAIPGGHEFTSLILAILNTDGKGKMPDAILVQRIQRLKKPISLQTYMSLTCENCPDVVQSLNQIALIHGSFTHEIIDGGYAQDDVTELGLQGVPSLIVNKNLMHSGRIQLLDLIAKLEQTFGIEESLASQPLAQTELGHYDVIVIGGGPAGSSAAIYTVRKGLTTALLTEKIGGQVQETKGIENCLAFFSSDFLV